MTLKSLLITAVELAGCLITLVQFAFFVLITLATIPVNWCVQKLTDGESL